MPAYFSVRFVCEKKNIYPDLVKDFCESLLAGGFAFLSGYWGSEEDSFADIIAWNQKKLEENYELGFTEHYSHGYKQMLFDYGGYSEVRMFVSNDRDEDVFSFDVIIPEDELIDWNGGAPGYNSEKIAGLERFCQKIWMQAYISTVQTELELSDPAPTAEEIRAGAVPGAEPFAILPKEVWQGFCRRDKLSAERNDTERVSEKYACRNTGRSGVLLRLKGVGKDMSDNTNRDLQERIIALIEEILGVPAGTITPDTLIEDVEEWDSLMHVTIIGELEEQLGISIPLDDAIELKSMPELLEKAGCL